MGPAGPLVAPRRASPSLAFGDVVLRTTKTEKPRIDSSGPPLSVVREHDSPKAMRGGSRALASEGSGSSHETILRRRRAKPDEGRSDYVSVILPASHAHVVVRCCT